MPWLPRNAPTTLRNAVTTTAGNGVASITIDGGTQANVPVYGRVPAVGTRVLVAVQGDQMTILGPAPVDPTVGYSRGNVGQFAVAANTPTPINSFSGLAHRNVTGTSSNLSPLVTGYWTMTLNLWGFSAVAARQFVGAGDGVGVVWRSSLAHGEDRGTLSFTAYLVAGTHSLNFNVYASGAANLSGIYALRYLGPE